METIKSFTIDHNHHDVGFYLSGESRGVYTYDIRFKKPNAGNYLSTAAAHTIEHLFATVIRNSECKKDVVYFGPMGCRTGFYLLLFDTPYDVARAITVECMEKCLELNEIPGSEKIECGNYLDHSLAAAKQEIRTYLETLAEK
jgi:LuxS protein involved in autoinducer AI2 synthesis